MGREGHVYSLRVPQEDADPQDVPDALPFIGISLLSVYLFLCLTSFINTFLTHISPCT